MAWNYSVLIHGYTSAGVFYDVSIEETSTNVTNNTSTLTITHKIRIMSEWGGNYEIPYNTPIYVTIDGTKYTYTPSMPTVYAGQTKTITTTTHTITHGSNGAKTAVVNCRWNETYRDYQGETGNKSLTLTTIPRASSMTAPNGTMGSSVTFEITRADSSFQHEITYSFNGHSGTAVSKTKSVKPSFTPALSTFGPWLPNATSGEIQYTLNTYSGNTKIGSATYKATLSVPSSATIKMASTDPLVITTLNGFNNQMLAGKSQARLTAKADTSSCYGATIKNYAFSIKNSSSTTIFSGNNPSTSTTAYADSSTMSSSGTFTAYVTISDSRGRTASTSKTFSVTAYSIPVIKTVTIFRSDSGGTASDSGTYASIKANATYASGVSGNSLTMTVATKKNTDSSYGTAQSLTNGTAKVISGFDADSIYNILIVASDTVGGRVEYTGTLSNVDVGIVWDAVKDNLGILTYPPSNAGSDQVYIPNGYAFGPDGATFSKLLTGLDFGQYTNAPSGLPLVSYSQLGISSSATAETYCKAWLKYICAHYAPLINTDSTTGSWSEIRPIVTMINPNDVRLVVGFMYRPTDLVDGLPRYASFRVFNRTNSGNYKFGTESGAWWWKDETGIGSTYSTRPSYVSCANATITKVATLTIPEGTWWYRGVGNWSANATGYRTISFENSIGGSRDMADTTCGTSGTSTFQSFSHVATYSSGTTLNLYAWQNSGGSLNVWPCIEAIRLS